MFRKVGMYMAMHLTCMKVSIWHTTRPVPHVCMWMAIYPMYRKYGMIPPILSQGMVQDLWSFPHQHWYRKLFPILTSFLFTVWFCRKSNCLLGFQIQNSVRIIKSLDNGDLGNQDPNVYSTLQCINTCNENHQLRIMRSTCTKHLWEIWSVLCEYCCRTYSFSSSAKSAVGTWYCSHYCYTSA